jgi:DNA polymerase-3 subunit epsilon
MTARARFAARVLGLYGAALAVPTLAGLLLGYALPEADAAVFWGVVESRAPLLALMAVLMLFACAGVVRWLHAEHVAPALAIAEHVRVIRTANAGLRLPEVGRPELAAVAAEIESLAGAYRALRDESDARAAEARARLEEERNRLAALMSELAQGVVVCNAEGTILLYNESARALFAPSADGASQSPVGLGRSVFAVLGREQVAHAMHRLERSLARGEKLPTGSFVTTTAAGRLVKVQIAPFLDVQGRLAGMVLALDDVTGLLGREAQRRSLLQAFAARIRGPAANIRAAAENLVAFPGIDAPRRTQFIDIVATESVALSGIINEALREYADALKAALVLEDIRAADLLDFARARIATSIGAEAETGAEGEDVWVRVDSYALVQAMLHLASRLREEYGVRRFQLLARRAGRYVEIDLAWSGVIVSSDALSLWELQPIEAGNERLPITVRDVLERHGAEAWYAGAAVGGLQSGCFRFLIPGGEPAAGPVRAPRTVASRPEYYDFDLFGRGPLAGPLHEARLADLSYTVFDTETTGLEPSAGDEIISIGAVRIVNRRLLRNEIFEQLVDPGRPINPASARVHGIDAATLRGQPAIAQVLPAFHRFCEDTVLVAHNAAFDMRFLELKRTGTGVHFAQPVLDTLLLSALAHPDLADHNLEAIAGRLGVNVIGRHTALGDALLTGEVFLKLLPLLFERGIVTLGQVLEASRDTQYARMQF